MYVLYYMCCASYCGGVFLVLLVGPVEGDFDLPTASLKGENGAVTECGEHDVRLRALEARWSLAISSALRASC